jgi:hypothetical protein
MEVEMATDALAKARKRKAEIIAIHGNIQRLNPLEKAGKNPKSLRLAVNAKCYECEGEDADPGWRGRIKECIIPDCPLRPVRPYRKS